MRKSGIIKTKILSYEAIGKQVKAWRKKNKKIVFTNGCFDILHLGHIDYLSKAADLGDILIIGLNTDASVRKIKGKNRPINNEISRSKVLASLFFVDAVVLFNEETPYNLIKTIQPNILVKGSDYKSGSIIGSDIVKSKGGRIVTVDFVEGYSTSEIEKRIVKMNK
ncbi:MAG: D-glycero-beta-D-manno-heptose 1-phosphate adenylyltransferase [Bacteroidales bacterium]|nr:D-glycero-beta-D-manno-heptose 1-phosphate adenylyltransferase [Bacteroidales bacterium]